MKPQEEHFAVIGRDFQERELHGLLVLARNQELQWRNALFVGRVERLAGLGVAKLLEAGNFFAARYIDDEIARDGEEPRFEPGLGVVLLTAFEDTNPGFLKKIFGERCVAGEEEKIAVEALLVSLDQAIEEVRIAAAESIGKRLGVVRHEPSE